MKIYKPPEKKRPKPRLPEKFKARLVSVTIKQDKDKE
jgi:hypothetical protein